MLEVEPGKEHEFRRLQAALAASDSLDRLIEAGELQGQTQPAPRRRPLRRAPRPTPAPRGLRARFAARLARLALALHREAATRTALESNAD